MFGICVKEELDKYIIIPNFFQKSWDFKPLEVFALLILE